MQTSNDNLRRLLMRAACRWLLAACGVALLAGIFLADVLLLRNEVAEGSLTELAQEWLLALAALAVVRRIARDPGERGFGLLWGGLLVAMLLRELDGFLDRLLWHGSWKLALGLWGALLLALVVNNRQSLLEPLARFVTTPACMQLMLGLLIIMLFSRLMGMGRVWAALQDDPPLRTVKNAVEEGIELLGYGLVASAALRYERAAGKPRLSGGTGTAVFERQGQA